MWGTRLIMIPLAVLLVWLVDPSSSQQDVLAALNAGTPQGRQELAQLLRPNNIPFVVACLSDPSTQGCDRRTRAVRNMVYVLSRTNFQCRVCPPAVQQDIDSFRNAIQSNPSQCRQLQQNLQLRDLC